MTWLKQVQGGLIDEGAPPRGDSVVGNKKPADPAAAAAGWGAAAAGWGRTDAGDPAALFSPLWRVFSTVAT